MTEHARQARNAQRLAECHPAFARRVRAIIAALEILGLRPRIQDAWRSPADQMRAYRAGTSRLRWGFHNATASGGTPEALAVDLLDDDDATDDGRLNGSRGYGYLFALAREARVQGCRTGIDWGLPVGLRRGLWRAVDSHDLRYQGKIGWDPYHVELADLTVGTAKCGDRPPDP